MRKQWLITGVLLLSCIPMGQAAELAEILPTVNVLPGWEIEEKVALYDKDTIFDYINGESEIYFPFGFQGTAVATYHNQKNTDRQVTVEVYQMGSVLDAFGIFSSYRKIDDKVRPVGAMCVGGREQWLFFKGPFFVKLQAFGPEGSRVADLMTLAKVVENRIPGDATTPILLELFKQDALELRSLRYYGESVLGYRFFEKGFLIDSTGEAPFRLFLIPAANAAAAAEALDAYAAYIKEEGQPGELTKTDGQICLDGNDPLYKTVIAEANGKYLVGAVKVQDKDAVKALIKRIHQQLTGL